MVFVVPRKITGISVEGLDGAFDLLDPAWSGLVLEEVDGIFSASVSGLRQSGSIVVGIVPAGSSTFEDNWRRAEKLFSPGESVRITCRTVASTRSRFFRVGDVHFADPYDYSAAGYRSIRVELTSESPWWYEEKPYDIVGLTVGDSLSSTPKTIELPPTGEPTIDWFLPEYDSRDTGGKDSEGATVRPTVLYVREKGVSRWRSVTVAHPTAHPRSRVKLTTDPSKPPLSIDEKFPVPETLRSSWISRVSVMYPRSNGAHEIDAVREASWRRDSDLGKGSTPIVIVRSYGRYRYPW